MGDCVKIGSSLLKKMKDLRCEISYLEEVYMFVDRYQH